MGTVLKGAALRYHCIDGLNGSAPPPGRWAKAVVANCRALIRENTSIGVSWSILAGREAEQAYVHTFTIF